MVRCHLFYQFRYLFPIFSILFYLFLFYFIGYHDQDDDGDNAFHIAANAAKLIRESLECIVWMMKYPAAAIEARNHRQADSVEY